MRQIFQPAAIYVMWSRELKRFVRAKSRLISTIIQPFFFLAILGSGIRTISFPGSTIQGNYLDFLAPGIITMSILFSSMFAGVSILWDKQFGFLQEVLVAPVSRLSIIIGRTLGGASTALIQGFIILGASLILGVNFIGIGGILLAILLMFFISCSSVGLGLIFASRMQDFQGFQLFMNLIMLPLLMLSGAFFPVTSETPLYYIALFNPVFYMVDGLRATLIGTSYSTMPLSLDIAIIIALFTLFMVLGSYLFSTSEA